MAYLPGKYYVLVRGESLPDAGASFSLTVNALEFAIQSIHTTKIGNSGDATVEIFGAKFREGAKASLRRSNQPTLAALIWLTMPAGMDIWIGTDLYQDSSNWDKDMDSFIDDNGALVCPLVLYNMAPKRVKSIPIVIWPRGGGRYRVSIQTNIFDRADYFEFMLKALQEGERQSNGEYWWKATNDVGAKNHTEPSVQYQIETTVQNYASPTTTVVVKGQIKYIPK